MAACDLISDLLREGLGLRIYKSSLLSRHLYRNQVALCVLCVFPPLESLDLNRRRNPQLMLKKVRRLLWK